MMLTVNPKEVPVSELHGYLLSAVIPRPIAFASTVDTAGSVNLSPFSFFNCFSANPPILVFSPSRRGRSNTTKHTYQNVKSVPEVVINLVNYDMVQQMSLASCEYPAGVNEFVKSGLTEVPSTMVRPPRVGESPVAMECRVSQVIELGSQGGAGNLVICELLLMHIKREILDGSGGIDPVKLGAVARMGGDQYLRVTGDNVFTVRKPNERLGIGFDQIPERILRSTVLTGNDLGMLANVERLPDKDEMASFYLTPEIKAALAQGESSVHRLAQRHLAEGKIEDAWKILLCEKLQTSR